MKNFEQTDTLSFHFSAERHWENDIWMEDTALYQCFESSANNLIWETRT